jgi:mono/diheme cytochrome c family protein
VTLAVRLLLVLPALALALLNGCGRDDMGDDAQVKPYEATSFFADGKTARPLVNGTVPRGGRMVNDSIYPVVPSSRPAAQSFPFVLTSTDLARGQQQFGIYCAVCHGALGDGNGMVVQRGFPRPPSFYRQRLRAAPPGHFYDVISNGYGAMYSYNDRVAPDDRWRITGYIRALQLSDPQSMGLAETTTTSTNTTTTTQRSDVKSSQ